MISDIKLGVLVAHNEPLLAAGLEVALGDATDFQVLTTPPSSLTEFLRETEERIDVVLADCKTGLQIAPLIRCSTRPSRYIVIVTQDDSEISIRRAMEAGVNGYLLQNATTCESVVQAVRSAARGGITLDPLAATRIADSLTGDSLTDRELEVLQLVALGLTDKVIASRLGISLGTVKCHVKQLLVKLQANTRTQAAAVAQRRGFVRLALPDPYVRASHIGAGHHAPRIDPPSLRSRVRKLAGDAASTL